MRGGRRTVAGDGGTAALETADLGTQAIADLCRRGDEGLLVGDQELDESLGLGEVRRGETGAVERAKGCLNRGPLLRQGLERVEVTSLEGLALGDLGRPEAAELSQQGSRRAPGAPS